MKLFVYDHCPYCVKARIVFGIKDLDFELKTLLNDDEKTPISMIGQKMVPILQKEDGNFMPESMEIIDYIDSNYGDRQLIKIENNTEISNWLSSTSDYIYKLCMPRWAKSNLEEFKTPEAIEYFANKKESYIGPFNENLAQSEDLIQLANEDLQNLDNILSDHQYPNSNKEISYSDIDLFARLRSLSIVNGIKYPKNVDNYRKKMSILSKINLHDDIAI